MTAPTADHAHWGIAAFCLSLDLGARLIALLRLPDEAVRMAARVAILANRAAVENGAAPLFLRDAIAEELAARGDADAARRLVDWVDTAFVTAARPANGRPPLLAPLRAPDLAARVDAALGLPSDDGPGYAASVHGAIDADASDALLEAVFQADAVVDGDALGTWDREIVARNAQAHSPVSPLAPLIHSLGLSLARDAAERVARDLGPAREAALRDLCTTAEAAT